MMKRFGLCMLVMGSLVASLAYAWQRDSADVVHAGLQVFEQQADFQGALKIDSVEVTATAAELNALDGVTATVAELNQLDASANYVESSVTNGQAVTLAAATPVVWLTGTGQADNYTNTITLATPYPVGQVFTLIVTGSSSNLIQIADSTTVVALGSNWVGDGTDTLMLYTIATNSAVAVSSRDN